MQTLKALLLAATLLGGATTAHATGLLPDSGFDLLAPGDTGTNFTPDWSVNNNAASKNNGLSSPSEIFSALPNYQTPSKSAGLITQVSTIGMLSTNFTDTVVGGLNLTFWVYNVGTVTGASGNLSLYLNNNELSGAGQNGPGPSWTFTDTTWSSGWTKLTASATAADVQNGSNTLTFNFTNSDDYLLLDSVDVENAPEPASLALLGVGLLGLGLIRRRKAG